MDDAQRQAAADFIGCEVVRAFFEQKREIIYSDIERADAEHLLNQALELKILREFESELQSFADELRRKDR